MPDKYHSVSLFTRSEDFDLQVARGQIAGHQLVNVQGYNALHGSTFRAVWEKSNDTDYVFPASSLAMTFSSTANETVTIRVDGLDASYNLKTATVTFSGGSTGTVTSGTSSFFRINALQVTRGSTTGTVTAVNGGTTYAQINPGTGRSQASIYTVPLGYTFYLIRAQAFTTNNGNNFCTYRVASQTFVSGTATPVTVLNAPFTQSYASTRVIPRGYPEKTDIQWQLQQSNPAPGSVQIEGVLINNGEPK